MENLFIDVIVMVLLPQWRLVEMKIHFNLFQNVIIAITVVCFSKEEFTVKNLKFFLESTPERKFKAFSWNPL